MWQARDLVHEVNVIWCYIATIFFPGTYGKTLEAMQLTVILIFQPLHTCIESHKQANNILFWCIVTFL